jgi:glutamate-5-semialdehyde dehydrogenase
MTEVEQKAQQAAVAARALATTSTAVKNAALLAMADALVDRQGEILVANTIDLEHAGKKGIYGALLDRLTLDEKRIADMADGLRIVAALPDPVGEVIKGWKRPNGLEIRQVRVPIGVIGIIYEARPNVTADAAGLCLKAGNACILRGGSEAINSNSRIAGIMAEAAEKAGVPANPIQLIESTDREAARDLMRMNAYVDALIPRGGAGLIRTVVETATVPVIETGCGNCHTYVESSADLGMASDIVFNAKVQRPGVCNATETLLVDEQIAAEFLPTICKRLSEAGVEIRGDAPTLQAWPNAIPATEDDYYTEYLALTISVKVVSSVEEAIEHINKYGTRHSEAIITENRDAARRFQDGVDSAAVYVNASTRFTDGFEFGFGAEIGISNQKLHARGPMGLAEITTYKYLIEGSGQIRG